MDNEDILMQFTAEEDVTSVVEAMESSVTSALDSITSSMDSLDAGMDNLSATAETMASTFESIESAFDSADYSASSFQTTIEGIDSTNLDNVSSSMDDIASSASEADSQVSSLADNISGMDGTTIDIGVESSGISDMTSEMESQLSDTVNGQDTSALRTSMYDDLVGMSDTIRGLGSTAVESASAAEQGWLQFGNAVQNSGLDWASQEDSVKSWVKQYSNNLGRGVADTRSAMTTFMNMGMSLDETKKTMTAVSNYAAQFGISQAEAGKSLQMAFMGAGRSVKKLGLDIADFKDEAGNVDKEKLLQAVMEKTSGAADKYANTYEARVQRMNNAINNLRTDFGKEIINTIEPLIPVVEQLFQAFSSLPQPIKSLILGFGGLAGGAAIIAGPLIKMRAYLRMGGIEIGSLTKGLGLLKAGYTALASGEGIGGAIKAMKEFTSVSQKAQAAQTMSNMGGFTPNMSTGGIAKNTTTVVKDAEVVASQAPAAEAAAAGTTATGGAMSGIATAFTSMIVPLLAIAAVVAVMIPIIAGLAAEALIFIKGIQLLIDALDFDSIDLTGAIDAIKQIGQAMFEMGVAMGAMTFSNIMTGLAVLTSGVTGLINPVQVAGQMLIQAADELQVFKNVKIDKSVPDNIKSISTSLKLVSDAMTSLTNVTMNMAMGNLMTLGGLLGNVNDAISTAKDELTHAANEISQLKNIPDLDQGAVDKLKKVSESLKSVATAMEALRSLRDGQNWDNLFSGLTNLFGGADIQSALLSVRDDVYKASNALSQFNGVADIPDGVSQKLKKVADSLKSVSESVEALRKMRDDYNWDSSWGNIFQGTDIVGAINAVRSDLYSVSASLRSLNDMSAIPEGTGQKIQRVTWTLNNVMTAITALKSVQDNINGGLLGGGLDLSGVTTLIGNAGNTIRQVATRIASLSSIANVPEGLGGKIQRVTWSVNNLRASVGAFNGFPQADQGAVQKVQSAVTTVRNVATQLNNLQGAGVNGGIGQLLASVLSAVTQLKATLASVSGGFVSSGISIGSNLKKGINQGLNGLPAIVGSKVTAAGGVGASRSWTAGARMGISMDNGFRSAFKISNIISSEMNFAVQAVNNGTGPLVTAVHEMAEKAVQEAQNTIDQHSPGRIARMFGAEMNYSAGLVTSQGQNLINATQGIASSVVGAWNPNFGVGTAFSSSDWTSRLNSMQSMSQASTTGSASGNVNIIVGEGAVQLDARNLTTEESRQIMINAIEGLDAVSSVNLNGE